MTWVFDHCNLESARMAIDKHNSRIKHIMEHHEAWPQPTTPQAPSLVRQVLHSSSHMPVGEINLLVCTK
jgi:hypothetical protein